MEETHQEFGPLSLLNHLQGFRRLYKMYSSILMPITISLSNLVLPFTFTVTLNTAVIYLRLFSAFQKYLLLFHQFILMPLTKYLLPTYHPLQLEIKNNLFTKKFENLNCSNFLMKSNSNLQIAQGVSECYSKLIFS